MPVMDKLLALGADRTGSYIASSQVDSETGVQFPGGLRGVNMVAVIRLTSVLASVAGTIEFVVKSCATLGGTYRRVAARTITTSTTDNPQILRIHFIASNDDEYWKCGPETFTGTYASSGVKYDVVYLGRVNAQ